MPRLRGKFWDIKINFIKLCMPKFQLVSTFQPRGDQIKAIKSLTNGLGKNYHYQTLLGVTGSGKTYTMANVINKINKPTLVIAPNKTLAAQLYREYKNFFPNNSVNFFVSYYDYYQPEAYLPITDTYIEKEAMINEEIDRLRHKATSALLTRQDVIVVASVSCIYNLGLPSNYLDTALVLKIGKPMVRNDLLQQLVKMQFVRDNISLKRGTFRLVGNNFEIIPAGGENIIRIEIEDQKINKIILHHQVTRQLVKELSDVVIFPPKHFVSSEPERNRAIKEIELELKERLAYFKKKNLYLEYERLKRKTTYDLEMIKTIGFCHDIENYSRHMLGKISGEPPETLLSYFSHHNKKDGFLTVIDESHISIPQIRGMYEGDRSRKSTLIQYGWRLPSALDNRPLKFNEFISKTGQTIYTSATPGEYELQNSQNIARQIIRPTGLVDPKIEIRPVFNKKTNKSQIDDLIIEITKTIKSNGRVIVNALTKKMAEDLSEYLSSKKIKARYMHSGHKTIERTEILKSFREGEFNVLVGVNLLREGLDLPEVIFVAILDADREGFLRSDQALIQTMGRASRNVLGNVIIYADKITGSIERAVSEVNKRRKIQIAYNKENNITPKTIVKNIEDLIDLE